MNKNLAFKILRWIGILAAAGVIYWSGSEMLSLDFWGYLPMYFFMACWLLLLLTLEPYYSKHPKKRKMLLLSSLAGVILYIGFPIKPVTPFMFIGLIPLLYIENEIFKWRESISRWEIFKYTFNTFITWNILSTFWVANTSFIPSIAAFTLNAAFMTLPWIGYHYIRKKLGDRYKYISLVSFWLCFEWIHLHWEISWPWLTLGNSFAQYPLVVQWYEFTGYLGGSLWILIMNILIYLFIEKLRSKQELKVNDLIYPVFLLFGPMMISVVMFVMYQEKGEWRNVSIIQPNYEPHYEKFAVSEADQLRRFVRLSQEGLTDSTDYLLYPETIFGYYDVEKLNSQRTLNALKAVSDSFPRANIVMGLSTLKYFDGDEKLSSAARELTDRNGEKYYLEVQNSAVQFSAGNLNDYDVHIKSRLVPGAEIFPYSKLLFFLNPIVKMAGGSVGGHGRQKERTVFRNQYDEAVAPVVCYESVYGEYVGQYMRKSANAIFIMTNDGWWDKTPGHVQHLKFASLRAIEHRRSIARSANTGVSAFFDQHGNIVSKTKYGEEKVLQGRIQFNKELTFYSKYGDIIARLGILVSLMLLVAAFVKRFKKSPIGNPQEKKTP